MLCVYIYKYMYSYRYRYRYRLKYKYSCRCRCRELSAQKLKENGPVLTELLNFQFLCQIPVFYNSYVIP